MKNYFVKRDANKILIRSAVRGKKRHDRQKKNNIHNNIISVIIGFVEHRIFSSPGYLFFILKLAFFSRFAMSAPAFNLALGFRRGDIKAIEHSFHFTGIHFNRVKERKALRPKMNYFTFIYYANFCFCSLVS